MTTLTRGRPVPALMRRMRAVAIAALLVLGGLVLGTPALAQGINDNPIDWTVSRTIHGKAGEDLPLREGQNDKGPIDGFGLRHIADGHDGFVPDPGLVQQAADTCDSNADPNATTTCRITDGAGKPFVVVWTERVDSRAPDGRPVGIITAYYA